MNIKKENEKLQEFWNNYFKELKPFSIDSKELTVRNSLDESLKYLGDNSTKVIDMGTGYGICLMLSKLFGNKMEYGLGIDTSVNGIRVAKETCEQSKIEGLEFKVGGNEILDNIESESFDGFICSNFLDVIPEETTNAIINNIKRIVKPNGIIVLKFNFYLTKELIEKLKMEEIDKNAYAMNGVLRGVNLTAEEWIEKFNGFTVLKTDEYERIPNGPKDRIIVLKKE